jgi:hypothetical protein
MLPSSVPMLASHQSVQARRRFPKAQQHLSVGLSAQLDEQLRGRPVAEAGEAVLAQRKLQLAGRRDCRVPHVHRSTSEPSGGA